MFNKKKKEDCRGIYNIVHEVFFPSRCLLCGELLLFQHKRGTGLCNECLPSLTLIQGKRCEQCSLPLISEQGTCLRCRERSYHFIRHSALFRYKGVPKELIYYYKFRKKYSLARLFSRLLHQEILNKYENIPVVPVPSREGMFFTKKENHLNPLIKRLKKDYHRRIISCLVRRGSTPQKTLSFQERVQNLRGNIIMKKSMLQGIEQVILFDDIFTTGATADECSRVLKENGVTSVYSVSLAID
jgi:ComF family protein